MAPRAVIRHAEWNISLDLTADAPAPGYSLACKSCGEAAPSGPDRAELEMWALNHTARNHDHRLFCAVTMAQFRVTPAPGNPLHQEQGSGV
ncbi:hypothetical protein [Streptomyces sp. G1]|uniref:DUF7848 domain-containing protein n=1 Tax=Streptomyces sp. G1 TaxID=361572 RepID=UPI00202E9654|nr:hypothetical protein [Streptomyces sp. G1]MCM1964817.1 hypothetical protein [Streptomyces sp. G1]